MKDPSGHAALEAASSMYARAFASATVEPAHPAITPEVLATIARALIRHGESLHLIEVDRGRVMLTPCGTWDVRGGPQESTWRYRVDLYGPTDHFTRHALGDGVVHCRYAVDPGRPWRGLAPLDWARATGELAGSLETRLSEEAAAPVGAFLALPQDDAAGDGDDDDDARLATLRTDIGAAKGRQVIVETAMAGWSEGKSGAPMYDWKPQRFGAQFPEQHPLMRDQLADSILDACGVPRALLSISDGTAAREGWRRFAMGSLEPLAAIIARELAAKLDAPGIKLSFESLWAHDLAGRAQSFKGMVEGGMSVTEAAGLSGLAGMADG